MIETNNNTGSRTDFPIESIDLGNSGSNPNETTIHLERDDDSDSSDQDAPVYSKTFAYNDLGANYRPLDLKMSKQKKVDRAYAKLRGLILNNHLPEDHKKNQTLLMRIGLTTQSVKYTIEVGEEMGSSKQEHSLDLSKLLDEPGIKLAFEELVTLMEGKGAWGGSIRTHSVEVGGKSSSSYPVSFSRVDTRFDGLIHRLSNNIHSDCAKFACQLYLDSPLCNQKNLEEKNRLLDEALKRITALEIVIYHQVKLLREELEKIRNLKEVLEENNNRGQEENRKIEAYQQQIDQLEALEKKFLTNRLGLYVAAVFVPTYKDEKLTQEKISSAKANALLAQGCMQHQIQAEREKMTGDRSSWTKVKEYAGSKLLSKESETIPKENTEYSFDVGSLIFSSLPSADLAREGYRDFCREQKREQKADGIEDALMQFVFAGDSYLLEQMVKGGTDKIGKGTQQAPSVQDKMLTAFNLWKNSQNWKTDPVNILLNGWNVTSESLKVDEEQGGMVGAKLQKLQEKNPQQYPLLNPNPVE